MVEVLVTARVLLWLTSLAFRALLRLVTRALFETAKSTFDHTYDSETINKVEVNGIEAGEFLLNAYAAGELHVPIIMVAGEAQLPKDDVAQHAL